MRRLTRHAQETLVHEAAHEDEAAFVVQGARKLARDEPLVGDDEQLEPQARNTTAGGAPLDR